MLPRRSPKDYTVGWLCALFEIEHPAAILMLDHEHEPADVENIDDENVYSYGDLNGHNVVIACLDPGQPGGLSAQRLVYPLRRSFPNLKLHLFVGIGGGIPRRPQHKDPYKDIHLGDFVIGWAERTNVPGIVRYGRVETLPNGQSGPTDSIIRANTQLGKALGHILSDKMLARTRYDKHLDRFAKHPKFKHPGLDKDVLFEASYHHDEQKNPLDCSGCDNEKLVKRVPRLSDEMVYHQGTILSGDEVMKDPQKRDSLSERYHDAICFEMEAFGVMEDTRCLVIKGISDYCDSHKNGSWQPYAAATAAAFAREILCKIRPHKGPRSPSPYSGGHTQQSSDWEGRQWAGDSTRRLIENAGSAQSVAGRSEYAEPTRESADFEVAYRLAEQKYNEKVLPWLAHSHHTSTLEAFQRAKISLSEPGCRDHDARRKIFFRMAQLETKLTYQKSRLDKKEHHMDNAETYMGKAMLAAEKVGKLLYITQTKLEVAFMKGRRLELKKERGLDGKHGKTEARVISQEISSEGQKLKELDSGIWAENSRYASWWLERLRKFS